MSEYDHRQYRLMLDRLNAFEKGTTKIGALIADLEGLVKSLESAPDSWKRYFLLEWADLEQVRATALSRDQKQFQEHEIQIIRDAIEEMKLLALQAIDDPANHHRKD